MADIGVAGPISDSLTELLVSERKGVMTAYLDKGFIDPISLIATDNLPSRSASANSKNDLRSRRGLTA